MLCESLMAVEAEVQVELEHGDKQPLGCTIVAETPTGCFRWCVFLALFWMMPSLIAGLRCGSKRKPGLSQVSLLPRRRCRRHSLRGPLQLPWPLSGLQTPSKASSVWI